MNSTHLALFGAVLLSSSVAIIYAIKHKKKKRSIMKGSSISEFYEIVNTPELLWTKVGEVQELYVYPLKSGKGENLNECFFDNYGILVKNDAFFNLRDRLFMVYEESTGKFMSGRQYPKLLLISVTPLNKNQAKLESQDGVIEPLVFDLPERGTVDQCSLWYGEKVRCWDCGSETSCWISRVLTGKTAGLKLGMGILEKGERRKVADGKTGFKYPKLRNEDTGIFSDLASYMIISNSSVDNLNSRLKKPITAIQLRPNLVISGCKAFDEDNWDWIKIGTSVVLRNFKLCTRCLMINVDPQTGSLNENCDPLKTLRSYRVLKNPNGNPKETHCPSLGIYCGLYSGGPVKLNDEVYVYHNKTTT